MFKKVCDLKLVNDFIIPKINSFIGTGSTKAIFKNMSFLATGTLIAQFIGFILAPIITRIYTPEDFGVLAIFTSILVLIVPLVTFRYSVAIPLPKNQGLAVNLVVLCLAITVIISLLFGILFYFYSDIIFKLISMPELISYWRLLVLGIFGVGLYETFSSWALREKNFKVLAHTKINQNISGNLTKIALGLLAFKPLGLLVGEVITQVAGFSTILWKSKTNLKKEIKSISKGRLIFLMKYYINFPKYQIGSRFLMAGSSKAPLFFMVTIFNPSVTGQLSLAVTVLAVPMSLIGTAVGKAYYAEVASIGHKVPQKVKKITTDITKKMFKLSLLPFVILLFGGPWLFAFIFGSDWTEAGWFSSMLSFSLLTQFISSPIVNTLSVFRKEEYYLIINMVRVLLIIVAFTISYLFNLNPLITVLVYSIFISIHRLFVYYKILSIIDKEIEND